MVTLVSLIAQDAVDDTPNRLVNYGALGIIVILFTTGLIVTGRQYRKLVEDYDELRTWQREHILPLIAQMTQALEQNSRVLEQNSRVLERLLDERRQSTVLPSDQATGRPPPKEGT